MKDTIQQCIGALAETSDLELVDLVISSDTIRVYIEKPGGIRLDDCSRLSREIYRSLDEMDEAILEQYRLEVSSPGIDRPLKTAADFSRNLGSRVAVVYSAGDRVSSVEGVIGSVTETGFTIVINGKPTEIQLDSVKKAQLVMEW